MPRSSDALDLEAAPAVTSRCLSLLVIGFLVVAGAIQLQSPWARGQGPGTDDPPDTALDATETGANPPSGVSDSTPVRLIPDQKVYTGSPPTTLDVARIIESSSIGQQGLERVSVLLNRKEKVVEASIVDDRFLVLDWRQLGKSEITLESVTKDGRSYRNTLNVEVWEADYWKLFLTVLGGLGVFLLGMKNLSGGLQAIAGQGLRRLIGLVTENRLMATGVGTLVTCLVQSSSITTVMVVGFVNSGFMSLSQAAGVIMGANIGTTITGWTLALKIGKYGLPLLGAGAFGYLFLKREKLRYLAMVVMGLGMIFFGLEIMKNGFTMVKNLPAFEAWFNEFSADSYLGVLKCASVGCILTFIVQSSSATLGITIGLAQIGVIPFETAGALVLGENLGTTITAWLASFGASTSAKRAAYFHVIFNLLGVAWITAIFTWLYMPGVKWFLGYETVSPENVTVAIAAVHSGFNIVNTLAFLPLAGYIANFLIRVIPEKSEKGQKRFTNLDMRLLETPSIAIEQSRVEVLKMARSCDEMLGWTRRALSSPELDPPLVRQIFSREEELDQAHDEIAEFITDLLSGNAPHQIVDEGHCHLRMADEYESISDYLTVLLRSHSKLVHSGLSFSDSIREELGELHDRVTEYVRLITEAHENRSEIMTLAKTRGEEIHHQIKALRDRYLARMADEERVDPQLSVAYTAQLNAYRRVCDHAFNIAEALDAVRE